MDATTGHILIDGNTAAALGALYAGATVGAWYPITPATSLMEAFKEFCERYRVDPATKEKKFCIIQAEDELSAAGMVIGASWAGARAFTSTAGPGHLAHEEFIGLAYYTETPASSSTCSAPARPPACRRARSRRDLMSIAYASHGDTKHIVLFPAIRRSASTSRSQAFDLAERFQTPVFVVSDLDIGMNDWMCKRLTWDDTLPPRPRQGAGRRGAGEDREVLAAISMWTATGSPRARSPASIRKGAYFTRGSGHDKYGAYTEESDAYQEVVDRIARKFETAAKVAAGAGVPHEAEGREDRHRLARRLPRARCSRRWTACGSRGIVVDYMRMRGFPFDDARARVPRSRTSTVFVVEQNRDAQLRSLLTIETGFPRDSMTSVLDYGGLPLTAKVVVDVVTRQ